VDYDGKATKVEFSSDGRRVLVMTNALALGQALLLCDVETGRLIGQPLRSESSFFCWGFSPDDQRVVTVSEDGIARFWDAGTGGLISEPLNLRIKLGRPADSMAVSTDVQRVLTMSFPDGTAQLWDVGTGQTIGKPLNVGQSVLRAEFSPDGQRVLTQSEDGTAQLWDTQSAKAIGEPLTHGDRFASADFSPDGQLVLTVSRKDTTQPSDGPSMVQVWDARTGNVINEVLTQGDGGSNGPKFSADSRQVLNLSTVREASVMRQWDLVTGKPIGEPVTYGTRVSAVQFSPDARRVVAVSEGKRAWRDKTARLLDAATGNPLGASFKHEGPVTSAQFNPDGQRVVTASEDGTARLWDAQTGSPLGQPMKHEGRVNSAQFSPDGRRVVTASWDTTARLWDAQTGSPIGAPLRHQFRVTWAQFSPDGQRLLTSSHQDVLSNGTVWLWNAATHKLIGNPMRPAGQLTSAPQLSPDGKRIVTGASDHTARLWDAATGKEIGVAMRQGARLIQCGSARTGNAWSPAQMIKPRSSGMCRPSVKNRALRRSCSWRIWLKSPLASPFRPRGRRRW
jgi:WD40 repeat protein